MKIKKKLTRKQLLKQEDEFLSTSAKVILWIKENYNKVIISLIVILVVMIVFFSLRYRSKMNLTKSNHLLMLAKNIYYTPVVPPTQKQDPSIPPMGFTSSEEKYEKALQLFQELKDLYPKSQAAEEAFFFIPNCLYFLKKYDDAIKGFEAYLAQNPNGLFANQARVGIGYAHEAKGDFDQSITAFQQILDNNPELILRDAIYRELGQIFEKMGSLDKAKEAFQSIVINFPESPFLEEAQKKIDTLSGEDKST